MAMARLLAVTTIFALLSASKADTTNTAPDEVEALKVIGRRLGHKAWNFTVDPCSGKLGWVVSTDKDNKQAVICNCSIGNDSACHVTSIAIKRENLTGVLPPELVRLPFLVSIDLTRNFIGGTIPRAWASMLSIRKISLGNNRLSGPIPPELGSISTLEELVLDVNGLSGSIPSELNKLANLKRLVLSSNNFTGELPKEIGHLKLLNDLRISDNNFRGKIPDFFHNLTSLRALGMQATGLEGPIPPSIAFLTNLTDLAISDLNGAESRFPPLGEMIYMKNLVLRNCNLSGAIPDIFFPMKTLKLLDLSFNKLTGAVPRSFEEIPAAVFVYLTGNMLNGYVPPELLNNAYNLDLSYNNYTWAVNCPENEKRNINYFGSSSAGDNVFPCSKKGFICEGIQYSLHINCGGIHDVKVDGILFEKDMPDFVGAASYSSNGNRWALSSTGNFLDNHQDQDSYTVTSIASLSMTNAELYRTARISPLSLTYYGFCLHNGSYNVTLHFAEIVFTDDDTYSSLGRRIFDVYIQGKLIWKDFNIKDEANGVGKAIMKNHTVNVTDNSLEIRLYWAGKGTTTIPNKGVYGPLISAISVVSNFPVPSNKKKITAILAGTLAPVICILTIIAGILWKRGILRSNKMKKGLDLGGNSFTLRQIKSATNDFHASKKIGEGGFGPVYKGVLSNGTVIAVKQLSSKSKQGNREFINEVGMISALQHPNLVKLYGCCVEGDNLLLIYEYMENNSLSRALFGSEKNQKKLDWPTRRKICLGITKGLAYLHEGSKIKIIHRDIKSTNILLDKDLNPKISDFGLAKLDEDERAHMSTRIAGTIGYMAPEYATRGYLTDKADVYSFGIVVLEIVSGKSNTNHERKEAGVSLLDWAQDLEKKESLLELVDPELGTEFNEKEVLAMIKIGLLCTNSSFIGRPSMSAVVSMLERRRVVESVVSDSDFSDIIYIERHLRDGGESGYDCSYATEAQTTVYTSRAGYSVPDSKLSSQPDLFSIDLDVRL